MKYAFLNNFGCFIYFTRAKMKLCLQEHGNKNRAFEEYKFKSRKGLCYGYFSRKMFQNALCKK